MSRSSFCVPWLVLGWCVLAGCSALIDVGGDQCSLDRDCDGLGFEATCEQGICVRSEVSAATCDGGSCETASDASPEPSPLGGSCVGSLRCEEGLYCFKDQCVIEDELSRFICRMSAPTPIDSVRFTMPVRDFVTDMPLTDMVVRACLETDVSCDDPVAMFEDTAGTGDLALELPYGFAGYLEVQSPDVLTSLWYFTKPLYVDTSAKVLKAVAPATLELLAAITSNTVDASKGIVIMEAFDCDRTAVSGVHFEESKADAVPFYIIDGLPNTESTITVHNEQDNQAAGGFLNATPGFTRFFARIGIDGPQLGSFNANVKANTVTYIDIHP